MNTIISKYKVKGNLLLPITCFLLPLGMTSCADWDDWTYDAEKPETIAQYEYLDKYAPLKENVDHGKHPNFKTSGALTASEYNNKATLYRLANHNLDEIVAGNAMKMSSCVGDKGAMDFSTVQSFVQTAEDADVSVYGHCLAWHSQQPIKWLSSLIADKELDIDPNAKIETEVAKQTYTDGAFPFYVMGCAPDVINGSIHFVPTGDWSQFFCSTGKSLTAGSYGVKVHIKSTKAGSIKLKVQNGWGSDAENVTMNVNLEEGWTTATCSMNLEQGGSYDFILQPETFGGTLDLESVTIVKYESPAVEVEKDMFTQTYTDGGFPYYVMGCAPDVINGSIHFVPTGDWSQFFCSTGNALTAGDYVAYVNIASTKEGSVKLQIRNGWGGTDESVTANVSVVNGWTTAKCKFTLEQGGNYDMILQPETFGGTLDLKSIEVKKIEKLNSIPLSDEEKKDTLTWAMTQWINGMMTATEGKVKAWDLINEAIGSGKKTGDFYDLQGSNNSGSDLSWDVGGDKFYWQDYLGAEDYGVIVEKAARNAYAAIDGTNPDDLKLFINDYNLESDWDDNLKLRSLIHWIDVWEKKGAKIDGIGTQMHVTYYENEKTQARKKDAITNMFQLMAKTGKLVRISELDMGYVTQNNDTLTTAKMTAITEDHPLATRIAQEKAMADFYQWIIEQYMTIIPAAQQYGICQWCLTDSPVSSSWRKGEPTGLWYESLQRKPSYGGWCEGLQK